MGMIAVSKHNAGFQDHVRIGRAFSCANNRLTVLCSLLEFDMRNLGDFRCHEMSFEEFHHLLKQQLVAVMHLTSNHDLLHLQLAQDCIQRSQEGRIAVLDCFTPEGIGKPASQSVIDAVCPSRLIS